MKTLSIIAALLIPVFLQANSGSTRDGVEFFFAVMLFLALLAVLPLAFKYVKRIIRDAIEDSRFSGEDEEGDFFNDL